MTPSKKEIIENYEKDLKKLRKEKIFLELCRQHSQEAIEETEEELLDDTLFNESNEIFTIKPDSSDIEMLSRFEASCFKIIAKMLDKGFSTRHTEIDAHIRKCKFRITELSKPE